MNSDLQPNSEPPLIYDHLRIARPQIVKQACQTVSGMAMSKSKNPHRRGCFFCRTGENRGNSMNGKKREIHLTACSFHFYCEFPACTWDYIEIFIESQAGSAFPQTVKSFSRTGTTFLFIFVSTISRFQCNFSSNYTFPGIQGSSGSASVTRSSQCLTAISIYLKQPLIVLIPPIVY